MIQLETLGGLRVVQDGVELRALATKPVRAPMLLVVAVDREVSRERLRLFLWGDRPPDRARASLSQTLLELKKELGSTWLEDSGERLVASPELGADVLELRRAARDGDSERVLELYRGPFLDGVQLGGGVDFEHWVDGIQTEVHRLVTDAFRVRAAEVRPGRDRLVVLQRWVDHDPWDEEAQYELIHQLAVGGNRSGAMEQYRRYVEEVGGLDLTPDQVILELVERIKKGDLDRGEGGEPRPSASPEGEASTLSDTAEEVTDDRLRFGPNLVVARLLGSGATGKVYLARQPALRRLVAIKVLDDGLAEHRTARERFEREAQSAARIFHPNVVAIHQVGATADGVPFYVMPYLNGVTIAERIKANGPHEPSEARRVLADAAAALAAAHLVGVIHRDVRPANLIYEEGSGRTFLVDFGTAGVLEDGDPETARLTRSGELLGNPEYISPEHRRGQGLTDRSDVYSLGVTGRELLLGRRSESSSDLAEIAEADPALVDLLGRACAENPRHRPSAADMAIALTIPPSPPERPPGLLATLMSRRMPQFVGAYLAGGFAGMEAVDQLVQQALLDPVAYRLALAFFLAGLNSTIVAAWFHGRPGRQPFTQPEVALHIVVVITWVMASIWIVT